MEIPTVSTPSGSPNRRASRSTSRFLDPLLLLFTASLLLSACSDKLLPPEEQSSAGIIYSRSIDGDRYEVVLLRGDGSEQSLFPNAGPSFSAPTRGRILLSDPTEKWIYLYNVQSGTVADSFLITDLGDERSMIRPYALALAPDAESFVLSLYIEVADNYFTTLYTIEGELIRVVPEGGGQGSPYSFSPDGRMIAYFTKEGTGSTILLITDSGKSISSIGSVRSIASPNREDESMIVWSPDGRKVAYSDLADSSLYVYDLLSETGRKIGHGLYPSWSPDGTQIVCFGNQGTFVIPSDGGDVTPLGMNGRYPKWSPDGKEVLCFLVEGEEKGSRKGGTMIAYSMQTQSTRIIAEDAIVGDWYR